MITINTVSSTKFSFNGVNYFKNFTPVVVGNKTRILNTYDSRIELTDEPTLFSDFTVDGVTFANVALLQDALLTVIFTRSSLGGGSSGVVETIVAGTGTAVDSTDPANPIVSESPEKIFQYFKGDLFMCQANGSSLSNFGYSANPSLSGTGTNQLADITADYSVSPFTTWYHRRQVSAGSAGSSASLIWQQRTTSVGLGFYASAKVNTTMVTNGRFFFGLTNSLTELPNANPSTAINMVGFGIDSSDTNLQVMHNDSSGTATKVDLGSDFVISSTNNPYIIEIWNFYGSSEVKFRVKNLLTQITSSIITVTTDTPSSTTGLTMQLWVNNGTTASAIPLHFTNHTLKRQS